MSNTLTVEERLTAVEQDLAEMKQRLAERHDSSSWIERIAGSFKDVPEFDEIVQLGRQFRESVE